MLNPQPFPPEESDRFAGFAEARTLMWCHESRARVHERLALTLFPADPRVKAVHVNTACRADRVYLSAFNAAGQVIDTDILYTDEPREHLEVTPEFDHDFTGMKVPAGSELADAVAKETGWVIDMTALRHHDLEADRSATQRAVFMAHMRDMLTSGQMDAMFDTRMLGEDEASSDDDGPGAGPSAA